MRASSPGLAAVFRRIDITPSGPVSLLGYFNERVSEGVLDPLYCRLAAFRAPAWRPPACSPLCGAMPGRGRHLPGLRPLARLLLVQIDTCLFDQPFLWSLRGLLRTREHGAWTAEEVLVFASHTHTAPALARLYEAARQERYARELASRIASAAGGAARALAASPRVAVSYARGSAPGLSFNRRWLDADGRAVTNPPREGRARLAGPEGPVDPELLTLWFQDPRGAPLAAFVSAVNHADTVGGRRISADWPGQLERELQRELGAELPVFFLPGAQGNINHFDPQARRDQTCPEEARRLGRAYAQAVLACRSSARPLPFGCRAALAGRLWRARLPGRPIPAPLLAAARALPAAGAAAGTLTASELAAGSPEVERVLARELLRQAPWRRRSFRVPLQAVRLGEALLCGIPGEPFVELGLALKAPLHPKAAGAGGRPLVAPVALAGGYYGYILPGERLAAGGYEALPASGRLGGAAGEMTVRQFRRRLG